MKHDNRTSRVKPESIFPLVSITGVLLAAFVWCIDALFEFLWLQQGQGSLGTVMLPLHDPHEILMRTIFASVLILAGVVVGKALQRLALMQRRAEKIAENLRITLNSIGDAVIATDNAGRITHVNPVAEEMTGCSQAEAQGQPLLEVFHIINAKTREPAFNPVAHVLETGKTVGLANHTVLIAKDGREYQIADSAAPIKESDNTTVGVVLVFRDVTEEYRLRDEMEQAHALLKAVVEQSHVPMVMATAPEGRIRLINQACLEFLGEPEKNYIDCYLHSLEFPWKFFTTDGHCLSLQELPLVRALHGEATHGLQLLLEDSQGHVRHTTVEGIPIRNSEGVVVAGLAVFPDTTERQVAEEERRKLQKLESVGTLAGGIAHDFNNILMGVFGGIELAKMSLPKDHAAYKYIETAHQALARATHLTKQLLTFAKGGDPLFETFRLHRLIRDAVELNLSGSNVKAEENLPEDLWPIRADRGQISHVLANLIINAKQAMPDGGRLFISGENITASADEHLPAPGEYVKIVLRDEGIGIPEKFLGRIFDPYFSTKQSGSGLGLAIVHSVVTKHHGHIRVESGTEAGTSFILYLPAQTSAPCREEAWYAQVVTGATNKGRVLVMDDDPMVREIAGEMLGLLGYECVAVCDGREALEAYRAARKEQTPFCCVIMDLTIPGQMGGKETIGLLLGEDPQARVIVASGYSTDAIMTAYGDYGFKGRLPKPFQLHGLQQELAKVLQLG